VEIFWEGVWASPRVLNWGGKENRKISRKDHVGTCSVQGGVSVLWVEKLGELLREGVFQKGH